MLTSYLAVVPHPEDAVPAEQLFHVTAALQTQITRDVGPLWGVACVVSPFPSLEHVPPGYAPLVVVPQGTLDNGAEHGFHIAAGGHPVALVEHSRGWSLLASHELIEMACDPFGTRTLRGTSLADLVPRAVGADQAVAPEPQGQVEYLVEVCDPCQSSTYTINGVLVSDFVTPQYYDPFQTAGARYSFTGAITNPREVLPGGYITWRTRRPEVGIWQAFLADEAAGLQIAPLTGFAPSLTRNWVDYQSTLSNRPDAGALITAGLAGSKPLAQAERSYDVAVESAQRYGARLANDIQEIVSALRELAPAPERDRVLDLFDRLGDPNSGEDRKRLAENPGPLLDRFRISRPEVMAKTTREHSASDFQYAAERIRANDRFGPDLGPVGITKFLQAYGVHFH